jgi:HK97 family phage portal protein
VRSLIGSIVDRAPVPLAPRAASLGHTMFGRARANQTAQLETYGSLGLLFGIVNRTSTTTAAVDWKLWRTAASGRREDRTEVARHAALDAWRRPNPFVTGVEFREASQQHIDLVGEMWWLVGYSPRARIPLELWTVRPDRIRPVPHPTDYLTGYIYTSPDGEEIPLGLDEVIPTRMPHPTDPYRGCGAVQSLLTSIDSARYSEEWNRNFFLNSAEPGGVVEVDRHLTDDEWDEFNSRWRESHRGVANAHRVAMLEYGAKWVNRAFSQRDMQFAELSSVGDAKIMQAFGIPKFALGMIDDVNRATAEASKVWFAEALTIPRLRRIRDTLNHRFLPLFGASAQGLEFDFEDPTPPDAEARDRERDSKADAAQKLVAAGYDGASVAEALDLPQSLVWQGAPARAPAPSSSLTAIAPWATPTAQADPPLELEAWETALADLIDDWTTRITPAQIADLVAQVLAAVNAGDQAALTGLTVDTADGGELLAQTSIEQANTAAAETTSRAAAAGAVASGQPEVDTGALTVAARATAALLGNGLSSAAGREALRVWGPGASGREVADAVEEHLSSLSDAALRTELGGALWSAEGAGRDAALAVLPAPTYLLADEVRDRNTCSPCKDIDGRRYSTVAQARADYPQLAGYRACDGRARCRGVVEPYWT